MTKKQPVEQIKVLLGIICPAYNAFQQLPQSGKINEILTIFAGATPERQNEILGYLGTSFQLFYTNLSQPEREELLVYFGITVSPPPYPTEQETINAVMAGKPSLYCFPFETEAIFYFIMMAYSNYLSDLFEIDILLFELWEQGGAGDGNGMNNWSLFIEYAIGQTADLTVLISSFTATFRE